MREQLYQRRKEFLLAKLKKEYEILRNKARFIKAVIEEEIQIKRVKKKEIARSLKAAGFATMSELNEIQREERRATVVQNDDKSDDEEVAGAEAEDEVAEGETPPREYDYLLTMPLWSLSEEKVAELSKQMHDKKDDHDQLEATHIHTIWGRDLDAFLVALGKQEEKDEKDRLAHKGVKVEGRGARAKARKAGGPAKKATEAGDAPKKAIKKVLGASQKEGKGGSGAKVSDGSSRKPKGSQNSSLPAEKLPADSFKG